MKIGLIATGDELTQGDILNTNGRYIANQLQQMGFLIERHIIVDDSEKNIQQAIEQQMHDNDIIILSGGLGPTSDDRTRFALAKAIKQELVFDETSWDNICQRLTKLSLQISESNRQQAYFPETATILANPNGSAAGCYLTYNGKQIIMLPGPPAECLPMFNDLVVPLLEPLGIPIYNFKWLLLGASEGEIASKLDAAVANLNCRTGYRWNYPYLEFKIYAEDKTALQQAEQATSLIVAPYFISKNDKTAKQQLCEHLTANHLKLFFTKSELSQIVKYRIFNANNHSQLLEQDDGTALNIHVDGLNEYWQQQTLPVMSTIDIKIGKLDKQSFSVCYRDERILDYIVELVCREILNSVAI